MKKYALLTSASAVAVVAAFSTVSVAEEVNLTGLVFEYDGVQFPVTYADYIDAIINESGGLYNLINNDQTKIVALGVEGEAYVDYSKFVNALISDTEGNTGIQVLAKVSTDTSYLVDDATVLTYQDITGYSDNGVPVFEDAVVPQVISIK